MDHGGDVNWHQCVKWWERGMVCPFAKGKVPQFGGTGEGEAKAGGFPLKSTAVVGAGPHPPGRGSRAKTLTKEVRRTEAMRVSLLEAKAAAEAESVVTQGADAIATGGKSLFRSLAESGAAGPAAAVAASGAIKVVAEGFMRNGQRSGGFGGKVFESVIKPTKAPVGR